MNMQTNTESMLSEAIRQSCVLMHVTCTKFGRERTDKEASKKSNRDHNAASDAARVVVDRLAGAAHLHEQIGAVMGELRDNLWRFTMPWGSEKGKRLMPNANIGKWAVAHKKLLNEFNELKDKLRAQGSLIIQEAEQNRGSYKIDSFSIDEMVGAYTVEHGADPLPNARDFAHLPEGVRHAFERDLETRIAGRIAEAKTDTVEQMKKHVTRMVERFKAKIEHEQAKASGKDAGKAPLLYDSVIENIEQAAETWDSFNVLKDPRMTELGKKLQRLTGVDMTAVKKNTDVAEAAIKDGEEILKDLDDLLIPGLPH